MKLTVTSGGVPAGSYLCTFDGIESITNDYGPGLSWAWEVQNGPHSGQTTRRITSVTPTSKNACGTLLAGLTGNQLRVGEEIDLSAYVGKSYVVVVTETERGGTRVESVATAPVE